jgi:hypothetical protein
VVLYQIVVEKEKENKIGVAPRLLEGMIRRVLMMVKNRSDISIRNQRDEHDGSHLFVLARNVHTD